MVDRRVNQHHRRLTAGLRSQTSTRAVLCLGGPMYSRKCVKLRYSATAAPSASAKVYDFGVRQTESSRQQRIWILQQENAMLTRVLSETRTEVVRLRNLLTAS